MARPSVIPDVRVRLEAYLNEREEAYLAQPPGSREPTLPSTPDGKVNVRAVAQAIDLKQTQEKYLYERVELSQLVSLMAEGQGLLPIGSRLSVQAGDKAFKERLVRQAQTAKDAGQAAVEAQAVHAELLEKFKVTVADCEALKAETSRLHAQLDAIHTGMFVRVED